MAVRVPATSANLGPGFDALGMAFSLYADVGLDGVETMPDGAAVAEPTHPAQVAFERAGGQGRVWVRNEIPMGRGLGYSGAVRIGGIAVAEAQQNGGTWDKATSGALALGTELEGHADNVAASLLGGVVATAGGLAVRVPMPFDPTMVMWVPDFETSTDRSRAALPTSVPMSDVVFNVGHTALLVAALAAGDISSLREATRDRLHQEVRFATAAPSRAAHLRALELGAWASWLSGSGPTVAAMCAADDAERIAAGMPEGGHTKVLRIDHAGAVIEPS